MSDTENKEYGLYIGGDRILGNNYKITYVRLSEVGPKSPCMIVDKNIKITESVLPFAMYNRGFYSPMPDSQGEYGTWTVLEDYGRHHFEIVTVLGVEGKKWLLLSSDKDPDCPRFRIRRAPWKNSMALFGVQRGDKLVLELDASNDRVNRILCNLTQECLVQGR